jgi:hypothetical protein
VTDEIRAVTDPEVAHLRDHGWAKLDQLISPELAARLLERAKAFMGPDGLRHVPRPGVDRPQAPWQDRHNVVEEDECFASVGLSPQMGANAQRLLRRKVGMLMGANMLAVKIGTKQDSSLPGAQPTPWHQDAPDQPIDRNGYIGLWIALDHVTPDMGGVRFVDRSHQLGLLGRTGTDLYGVYPELEEMTATEPMEMKPGDATAHSMYTVHSAGLNRSACPRWALLVSYIPEDALYTGGLPWSLATLAERARAELTPGDHFDSRVCPKVYG